ncbi:hypothetical protein GQ53DRAFT_750628 [Thozetella sp. PMI_491]|nr:hypothetical protein GQ53DRAFT_750628 [Thozetella sp. PMI_491]
MVPVRKPGRPLSACPHLPSERATCGCPRVTVAFPKKKCACPPGASKRPAQLAAAGTEPPPPSDRSPERPDTGSISVTSINAIITSEDVSQNAQAAGDITLGSEQAGLSFEELIFGSTSPRPSPREGYEVQQGRQLRSSGHALVNNFDASASCCATAGESPALHPSSGTASMNVSRRPSMNSNATALSLNDMILPPPGGSSATSISGSPGSVMSTYTPISPSNGSVSYYQQPSARWGNTMYAMPEYQIENAEHHLSDGHQSVYHQDEPRQRGLVNVNGTGRPLTTPPGPYQQSGHFFGSQFQLPNQMIQYHVNPDGAIHIVIPPPAPPAAAAAPPPPRPPSTQFGSMLQNPPTPGEVSTSWNCNCGPDCQCVGCVDHPFNTATQGYVRSAYSYVLRSNAYPQERNPSNAKIETGPSTGPGPGIDLTNVGDRQSEQEQDLPARDFFFVDYDIQSDGVGEAQGSWDEGKCAEQGEGCTCLRCRYRG